MKCQKCGALLRGGELSCPQCGERIASQRQASGDARAAITSSPSASMRGGIQESPERGLSQTNVVHEWDREPALADRVRDAAADTSTEKVLCVRCMNSFPQVAIYELGGKSYCERCFHIEVGDAQPEKATGMRVEVTLPTRYVPRLDAILWSAFRITCVLVVIGFVAGVIYLVRPRPKWSFVPEYDAPPAFRPTVVTTTLGEGKPSSPSSGVPSTAESALSVPSDIVLPIIKGSTQFICPACETQLYRGVQDVAMTCPTCGTRIVFKDYVLVPSVKYVGRDQRGAVLRVGNQERCLGPGEEISSQTHVYLDRFVADGVVFAKTENISFVDKRINPPQRVQKTIRLEQMIPKYRDDETSEVAVVQGTPSIICDGRGVKEVYHSNPIEIKIDAHEPRTLVVACPMISCWKQFRVTVRAAPFISVPVTTDMDQVPCPACGFIRHLASVDTGTTFTCLNCKRTIRLTVVSLIGVKYLGQEGGTARIEHNGVLRLVSPGKEIWPGSGVILAALLENGRALCTQPQTVTFTDYHTVPPTNRTSKVLLTWTLSKTNSGPP